MGIKKDYISTQTNAIFIKGPRFTVLMDVQLCGFRSVANFCSNIVSIKLKIHLALTLLETVLIARWLLMFDVIYVR